MRSKLWLSVLLMMLVVTPAFPQTCHVILISVDGRRPAMYLDSSWPAPKLRYLIKRE
jgi:hypothetical protein